jgi:sarcosine oxidase subunit beta
VKRTADVVVVGGGVNGLSLAFHLAREGAGRVVLLERRHLAAGATGKSGALVRTHYTNEPETRLAHESLKVFAHWSDVVGGECGFDPVGLVVFVAGRHAARLDANLAMHRSVGVDTRRVTAAELRDIDPDLRLGETEAACYEPASGYADPNLTAYAFARAALRHGVEICLETQVTAVRTMGGRVAGVTTSRGDLDAATVVVAAGAWTDELLAPLGIDLGLRPCHARVVLFRPPFGRTGRRSVTVIDHVHQTWMRPDGSRLLVGAEVGGERDVDPDAAPEHVDAAYIARCHRQLVRRLPVWRDTTSRGNWAGVITMSPDGRPLIGALDGVEGLYCVAGDSGTSFKTSPAIGQSLAELIVRGRAELVDLTPFRPGRVADGALWRDPDDYELGSATISR